MNLVLHFINLKITHFFHSYKYFYNHLTPTLNHFNTYKQLNSLENLKEDDQLIEDLSKDYNNEDNAVLNCVINNYTNANIHEQHNNLTCCASLPISKSTKYLNNIKRCNEYIHLPNGKNVLSTIQSEFLLRVLDYFVTLLSNDLGLYSFDFHHRFLLLLSIVYYSMVFFVYSFDTFSKLNIIFQNLNLENDMNQQQQVNQVPQLKIINDPPTFSGNTRELV
ncbi:hypothetical protein H8356DRAFT_1358183 [Neocallimastix lanati (nom. inval.)]|nr:hypothetical protein H8356DRAFT_1358183 [Neocallimastix sp. JGI-2020a]